MQLLEIPFQAAYPMPLPINEIHAIWNNSSEHRPNRLPLRRELPDLSCLKWLDIAMAKDNAASIRTAGNAGAKRVRPFHAGPEYGNVEAWLYRLPLDAHPACGDKRL